MKLADDIRIADMYRHLNDIIDGKITPDKNILVKIKDQLTRLIEYYDECQRIDNILRSIGRANFLYETADGLHGIEPTDQVRDIEEIFIRQVYQTITSEISLNGEKIIGPEYKNRRYRFKGFQGNHAKRVAVYEEEVNGF